MAFRWPMKAKVEHGAKIIHVDPRFTRTSSVADIYAPVRAGSDIAFLGGVIKYVLDSEKWNNDPFFKSFVVNYTNAATIINEDFKDTEELNGVFSGLLQSKGGVNEWPFNGFINQYDGASWQYATRGRAGGEAAASTAQSGETMRPLVPKGPRRATPRRPRPRLKPRRARRSTLWWHLWSSRRRRETRRSRTHGVFFRSSRSISRATRRRWWRRRPAAPRKRFSKSPRRFWRIRARTVRRHSPMPWPGRSTPTASK